MDVASVVVSESVRADVVVTQLAGSRRRAREAIASGKVYVNGRALTPEEGGLPVPEGARVEVRWNQPGTSMARKKGEERMTAAGLRVLFEDEHMVAVDKPPGLLTDVADLQQARERDSVKKRLHAWLKAKGREALVVHRIDRDTSGVVLFGTHEKAGEALRAQFAQHQPDRFYLCVVRGVVNGDQGEWVDMTLWDRRRLKLVAVGPHVDGAMPTRSVWRVLERFADATVLEVQIDTGRRNQIRLQAALRGHPLVGERIYTSPELGVDKSFPRQALHAWRVAVDHPTTGRRVRFEAPVPADFQALLGKLRRGLPATPPTQERERGHRRR